MRKALLFAPMLMLLLTACGGGGEKQNSLTAQLQAEYAAVASATMEADITCHYEDEVREYTLLCAYTPESSTVTVLSPANLAGISATVEGGVLSLTYDGISMDAGNYSAGSVSPVAALPRLMEAAAKGYVSEQGEETLNERSCLRLACGLEDDEGMLYATWFDQETLLPLRSEISADGVLVFEVAWSRFEVTDRQEPEEPPDDTDTAGDADPSAAVPQNAVMTGVKDWTEADEAAAYANAEE
ncbi:MAG: hypothetical protein K2O18_17215 [Oscillospiraceae bacterium]|nr:hypothetical protein [Oscillospiraceae bacterium]